MKLHENAQKFIEQSGLIIPDDLIELPAYGTVEVLLSVVPMDHLDGDIRRVTLYEKVYVENGVVRPRPLTDEYSFYVDNYGAMRDIMLHKFGSGIGSGVLDLDGKLLFEMCKPMWDYVTLSYKIANK